MIHQHQSVKPNVAATALLIGFSLITSKLVVVLRMVCRLSDIDMYIFQLPEPPSVSLPTFFRI